MHCAADDALTPSLCATRLPAAQTPVRREGEGRGERVG